MYTDDQLDKEISMSEIIQMLSPFKIFESGEYQERGDQVL